MADLRSESRPLQRRRNHFARYNAKGGGNLPRIRLSAIRREPGEFFTAMQAPYSVFASDVKPFDPKYDPTKGETPGNARRKLFKTIAGQRKSNYYCSGCEVCNPPPLYLSQNVQSKRSLAKIVKDGRWKDDDVCTYYPEVRASLWDEGILEDDYLEPDGGGLAGGDWSGAVDIAEKKFQEKAQGSRRRSSGAVSRSLPQSPCSDSWVLWEDDDLEYAHRDWEVV